MLQKIKEICDLILDCDINKFFFLSTWKGIRNWTDYWNLATRVRDVCERNTPPSLRVLKGNPHKLSECCIFASLMRLFPWQGGASPCHSNSSLSLPRGLCNCCSWHTQSLPCCLLRYTRKLATLLIVVFLTDGLRRPLLFTVSFQDIVSLFDPTLKRAAGALV